MDGMIISGGLVVGVIIVCCIGAYYIGILH